MSSASLAVPESSRVDCLTSFDHSRRYCAEVPSDLLDERGELLDWLIGVAFDTFAARVFDLRVVHAAPELMLEA